jgi:NAD(P)-dependent dehydrogenase (short-subunit alcohol dehydrogenase family)
LMPLPTDVSSASAVDGAVAAIAHAWGRIDVVVNNAGIAYAAGLHEHSNADWDRVFSVNVKSAFLVCRAALELLKASQGTIVNVSSMTALVGQPRGVAYTASKGALIAMTKALALELAPAGIRVNCVCPAGVDTPLMQQWAQSQNDPQAVLQAQAQMHILGRMATPDEIGNAIVFLATPAGSFITGVILPVEGGATLGYRRV